MLQLQHEVRQALTFQQTLLHQAFKSIFTSPSSASKGEVTSRWHDVASVLHMNNHVTPRSIAYTTTQVCLLFLVILRSFLMTLLPLPQFIFSLSTAQEWKCEHNSFHYPIFYNFIVNFFEDIEDDAGQKNTDELLDWWNRYIIGSIQRQQS